MTEAMPFLQKYDITFLRPPTIGRGSLLAAAARCTDSLCASGGPISFSSEKGRFRASERGSLLAAAPKVTKNAA